MIGGAQMNSYKPQKSEYIYRQQNDINKIFKIYDNDSNNSSIASTKVSVPILTHSGRRLKPVVEQEEDIMEFMDVFKQAVSRHSLVVGSSVAPSTTNGHIAKTNKNKVNELELQKQGRGGKITGARITSNSHSRESQIDKDKVSYSMKLPHIMTKLHSEMTTSKNRSNISVSKPPKNSKTRSNLLIAHSERDLIKDQYESIQNDVGTSELARSKNSDNFQKNEVQEFVESRKIPDVMLLQSRRRKRRIPSVSSEPKNSQKDKSESSNISLGGSEKNYSISSEKSSKDDLKYLLPHLEEVTFVRKSIEELNELVNSGHQDPEVLNADEDTTGIFKEVTNIENLPKVTSGEADKGVAFREKPPDVTEDLIQASIIEDLPIWPSQSPIDILLKDLGEKTEDSVSDEQDQDLGFIDSFLVDNSINGIEYNYEGDYDLNNLRTNFGCMKWISNERRKYCGYFQYNSLHGDGYYFIKRDGCYTFYDGKFYNNKLHGYGQLIYNNGDKFEGLFRANVRFGPGILTNKNDTQDVGIWFGNSIIRLSVDISETIAKLGKTNLGKLKLLEYKKIISLNKTHEDEDIAYSIMNNLNTDEDTKKRFKELYNPHVRNTNSIFIDKSQYDHAYFGREDFDIEVIDNFSDVTDFMQKKKGYYPERLKENESIEVEYIDKLQKKLKCLKKNIKSLREQLEHNINGPKNFRDENLIIQLQQDELFLRDVLKFLYFKLNKTEKIDSPDYRTKKIFIDSLIAWNNNDLMIDILKHSFLCRRSEKNVSFNVRNVITEKRSEFGKAGEHENSCIKFLESCLSSNLPCALQLLANQNVNPNVCDSKGNSGLHLATWNHDTKMIGMLANHGANLDIVNDEGISPLNLCLLRYLQCVYGVVNWETSFLFLGKLATNQEVMTQWRPTESFWNLLQTQYNLSDSSLVTRKTATSKYGTKKNISGKKGSRSSRSSGEGRWTCPDRFIFTLTFVPVPERFAVDSKKDERSLEDSKIIEYRKRGSVRENSVEAKQLLSNKMTQEVAVLKCLLHYGADANKEGVPYSSFFMALFSKSPEIVEYFLKARADPNINLHGMSPLQVVACLEPCEENYDIMQILIDNCSNPNLLSDPTIWQECDKQLLGNFELDCEIEPRGKDALHFICLREDFNDENNFFLCQMAEKLIRSNLNTRPLYLGHSHITMAIIKGNVALVDYLSKYFDLKRPLGFGLGNALTILALKRYQDILPFHICKSIIDLLFSEEISPFEPLYCYCNIFEFLDVDSPPNLGDNLQVWKEYINYMKPIRDYFRSQSLEDLNIVTNELSKIYIQEKSRTILDVINKFKAVFYLYCFIRERSLDQNTKYLAKMIRNSEESLKYILYIFNSGKMPRSYFSLEYISEMMYYVDNVNNVRKTTKVKPEEIISHSLVPQNALTIMKSTEKMSKASKKSLVDLDEKLSSIKSQQIVQGKMFSRFFNRNDYLEQLNGISFEECDVADDSSDIHKWVTEENLVKCNVCYFCMHRTNKTLLRCPSCGIVKFCSKRCNYLSIQLRIFHPCPGLFYQRIHNEYRELLDNNLPIPIYGIDLVFDNLRKRSKVLPVLGSSLKTIQSNTIKDRLLAGADQEICGFKNIRNSAKTFKNSEYNIIVQKNENKQYNSTFLTETEEKEANNSTHSNQRRTIKRKFFERNINYDNENHSIAKDFSLRALIEISKSLWKNISETIDTITENDTDDANMVSLISNIEETKRLNVNVKRNTFIRSEIDLRQIHFPTFFNDLNKLSTHIMKQKTTKNILDKISRQKQRTESNFMLEKVSSKKHLKLPEKRTFHENIVNQVYQYFLHEFEDLDIENIFTPFTCFRGNNIFHSMSADCNYFYQSFDDSSSECSL